MTTIAAILALLPLAIGLGQGSDMPKPLAVAIISGLIVQMPLVLLVMPLAFSVLHRNPRTRMKGGDSPSFGTPARHPAE
jgi:multidrug efflux pump subunit AcrB